MCDARFRKEDANTTVEVEHSGAPLKRRQISLCPTTALGRWGVGLLIAFFALVFLAGVVPRGAALGFAAGLTGGAMALIAIMRDRERAVSVFVAVVPLVIAIAFVVAELISGA
jgi:hypothetical protein